MEFTCLGQRVCVQLGAGLKGIAVECLNYWYVFTGGKADDEGVVRKSEGLPY